MLTVGSRRFATVTNRLSWEAHAANEIEHLLCFRQFFLFNHFDWIDRKGAQNISFPALRRMKTAAGVAYSGSEVRRVVVVLHSEGSQREVNAIGKVSKSVDVQKRFRFAAEFRCLRRKSTRTNSWAWLAEQTQQKIVNEFAAAEIFSLPK